MSLRPVRPRHLRLLRVEDENVPSPASRFPVEDLGRIGRWSDFVRGLSGGSIHAEDSDDGVDRAIPEPPELVTIDFRFHQDFSTPPFRPDPGIEHPVLRRVGWSERLRAKNTGVILGATIVGLCAGRDLPTVSALHTLAPDDTRDDVTTTLLVGQMLAAEGREFQGDPFVAAWEWLGDLPTSCDDALPRLVATFRARLEDRFRDGPSPDRTARLFVNPDSVHRLLAILSSAKSEDELDAALAESGLEVWDRDGDLESLDLRSLFLDLLQRTPGQPDRRRLPLPDPDAKEPGPVVAFLERVMVEAGGAREAAAAIVQANLEGNHARVLELRSTHARLLALVFALCEESLRARRERVRALDEPGPESEGGRTPRELMLALARALERHAPPDRAIALAGTSSIAACAARYAAEADGPYARTLEHAFGYAAEADARERGEKIERAVRTRRTRLLRETVGRMVESGLLEREEGPEGEPCRYRIGRKNHRKIDPGPGRIDLRAAADLLGFQLAERGKELTVELSRILSDAGFRHPRTTLARLVAGPLPAHLAQAAMWYVERHHPEIEDEAFPPQCRAV